MISQDDQETKLLADTPSLHLPTSASPIGVFDSGVGGLTVARAIAKRLPRERLIYLGDTARVPYGTKSPATVLRYTEQALDFFVERGVKLMVVACNTASAAALPDLSRRSPLPILGVVEPGARAAAASTTAGIVGVIGTRTTVESGSYDAALQRIDPKIKVHSRACPLLVPLAEEGWLTGPVPRWVAQSYLEPLSRAGVDTLVLGCTHYPLLRGVIGQVMGDAVQLVDSAEETARAVEELLESRGMSNDSAQFAGKHRFFTTDVSDTLLNLAEKFFAAEIKQLEIIDLEQY